MSKRFDNREQTRMPRYLIGATRVGHQRWQSRITINGKVLNLGTYPHSEDAAFARDVYIVQNGLHSYRLSFPHRRKEALEAEPIVSSAA